MDNSSTNQTPPEKGYNSCMEGFIKFCSMFLIIITFPISIFFCVKIVNEYERAVIFRLGRLMDGGVVGPGLFFIIPCMDWIQVVDLRVISFDVPAQEILTKDSVTVQVDAVVYYNIEDPMAAVCHVEQAGVSTRLLASTTLRNILGTKTLQQILSDRENTAQVMKEILDTATDPWGIKVERVEVKDVRLPLQMQRAMAAEAEADRDAKAKVVAAQGEKNAAVALKEASDTISDGGCALQLRYLQTLAQIATEKNSTIVFPIPLDLLGMKFGKEERNYRGENTLMIVMIDK